MTVLSFSYGIIMDRAINEPGQGNNAVDGINAIYKRYLKQQMGVIGKSESNNISNTGILSSASKEVSIQFADKFIHILNNKDGLNGLKVSTQIQNRESLFRYQSLI